jgi:hypothetical protein
LLALADSLADRLARLDELFARAGHRGSTGLKPLLQALQHQAYGCLHGVITAARSGAADRLVPALHAAAATIRQLHARLDLVPGTQAPAETDWLLTDWLGDLAADQVAPPVLPSLSSYVHGTFLPDSTLCSLYLPVAELENPLAWTLLAQPLGLWLAARAGVAVTQPASPLEAWTNARLADHLALRMVGPAYVFALAYGEPERWLDPQGEEPSFLLRLRWTLDEARAAGFEHPQLTALAAFAEAVAADVADDEVPAGFAAGVPAGDELWGRLPTFTPQAFATAAAMVPDLRQGLPISARPRLPQAEQQQALDQFKAQSGFQPGTAVGLLALLKDQANDAATILNAGWLYRNDLRSGWLDEMRETADGVPALRHARLRGNHLDQLLQKSLETATIHRLLQESRA